MKDKTLAGILALFLGFLGVHRFYLGQPKYGILYLILLLTGVSTILGLIDAIVFLTMDQEKFDEKYNRQGEERYNRRRQGRRQATTQQQRRHQNPKYIDHRKQSRDPRRTPPVIAKKKNPFKLSGIQKYKDYDFEGAIADFKKALAVNSKDIAIHFNLACAYSITEKASKALYHLSMAVEHGFVDFDKIKNHDALAYLRIQDEFEEFVNNGYCLDVSADTTPTITEIPTPQEASNISIDLLEQIKKLGELREKGFLTEEEFAAQKRRLLR